MSRRSAILDRVIGHLYFQAQKAACREEHELWSITLRLIGLARRGDPPSLDWAAYLSVGRSFEKWRRGTQERLAMMAWELAACVPDYDPQEVRRMKLERARRLEKSPVSCSQNERPEHRPGKVCEARAGEKRT